MGQTVTPCWGRMFWRRRNDVPSTKQYSNRWCPREKWRRKADEQHMNTREKLMTTNARVHDLSYGTMKRGAPGENKGGGVRVEGKEAAAWENGWRRRVSAR